MQPTSNQLLDNGSTPGQRAKDSRGRRNIVRWWFETTGVPEPAADADFPVKDEARRSRLVSTIAFLLLVIFIIYIPSDINNLRTGRIGPALVTLIAMPTVIMTIILLNRSHRVLTAGIIVTIAAETVFTVGFFNFALTNYKIAIGTLYYIELYVIGELFAVSLLPAASVFLVALFNSALFLGAFTLLPHDPTMDSVLPSRLVPMMTVPITVQMLVAAITYIWVRGSLRSLARADRAEAINRLEHQISLQLMQTREEKLRLEETIQRIVQSHIDTLNNQVVIPLSLSEDTKILWPLVNVITSLQRRLRYSYQVDRELRQLHKAIKDYSEFCYQHGSEAIRYGPRTRTKLDMLLSALVQSNHFSNSSASLAQKSRPPGTSGSLARDGDYLSP